MFVIKDNTIEYNTGKLLGSSLNTQGVQLITPPPGIIQYPLSIIDEQILLINNSSLNTMVTSDTNMIYIVNNIDNVDTVDTTTLNNNSNSIILLSNNSFTLSTKVKRAYASMNGVSTENNCPLGYCTGLYYTYLNRYKNSILLFLSNEAQEIIHNNICILVNISIIGQIIGNNVSSTDVIAGFMPYSFATNRNFYNGHQSSLTYSSDQYINFYESFVTWESIINIADTYCLQLITSIIDPSNTSSDIVIPFSGIVYYRLEMIVYEG